MILTHGGNSIGKYRSYEYIKDNFVALYNGITDAGLPINDGSFGALLRDTNGPIVAPDGLGMPYYARANFTGNNGGVQCINDSLKSIFSLGTYTIDFWYRVNLNKKPDNQYVMGVYNSDRSYCEVFFKSSYSSGNKSDLLQILKSTPVDSMMGVLGIQEGWNHVAITRTPNEFKSYHNGTNSKYGSQNTQARNDMNTIRFRFDGEAADICIAQFALRDHVVWASNFTPPTQLYKQI